MNRFLAFALTAAIGMSVIGCGVGSRKPPPDQKPGTSSSPSGKTPSGDAAGPVKRSPEAISPRGPNRQSHPPAKIAPLAAIHEAVFPDPPQAGTEKEETPKEYGLLLVRPGGSGNERLPAVLRECPQPGGNSEDVIVAELVAPVWNAEQSQNASGRATPSPRQTPSSPSEQFTDAVIEDVGKRYKIHPGWISASAGRRSGHVVSFVVVRKPEDSRFVRRHVAFHAGAIRHTRRTRKGNAIIPGIRPTTRSVRMQNP